MRIASLLSIFAPASDSAPAGQGGGFDAVLLAAMSDTAQQRGGGGSTGSDAQAQTVAPIAGDIAADQENQTGAAKSDAAAEAENGSAAIVDAPVGQSSAVAMRSSSTPQDAVATTAVPAATIYWGRSASITDRQSVATGRDVLQQAASLTQNVASTTASLGPVQFHAAQSLSRTISSGTQETVDSSAQAVVPRASIVSFRAAPADAAPSSAVTSLSFAAVTVLQGNRTSGTAIDASAHDAQIVNQPLQPSQASLSQAATAAPKASLPAAIRQGIGTQTQAMPVQRTNAVVLRTPLSSEAGGSTLVNDGPVDTSAPAANPIALTAFRVELPATKPAVREVQPSGVAATVDDLASYAAESERAGGFVAGPVELRSSTVARVSTVEGASFLQNFRATASTVPAATLQTAPTLQIAPATKSVPPTTKTAVVMQTAATAILPAAETAPVKSSGAFVAEQASGVHEKEQVVSATPQSGAIRPKASAAAEWLPRLGSVAKSLNSTTEIATPAMVVSSTAMASAPIAPAISAIQTPLAVATGKPVEEAASTVRGAEPGALPWRAAAPHAALASVDTTVAVTVADHEVRDNAIQTGDGSLVAEPAVVAQATADSAAVKVDTTPSGDAGFVAKPAVIEQTSVGSLVKIARHSLEAATPTAVRTKEAETPAAALSFQVIATRAEVAPQLPVAAELLGAAIGLPTAIAQTNKAVQVDVASVQKDAPRAARKDLDASVDGAALQTDAAPVVASADREAHTGVKEDGDGDPVAQPAVIEQSAASGAPAKRFDATPLADGANRNGDSVVASPVKTAALPVEAATPAAAPSVSTIAAQAEIATAKPVAGKLLSAAIDFPTVAAQTDGAVQASVVPAQKDAPHTVGKNLDTNGAAAAPRTIDAGTAGNGSGNMPIRNGQSSGQPAQHGSTNVSAVAAATPVVTGAQSAQTQTVPNHEPVHDAAMAARTADGAADGLRESQSRGDAAGPAAEVDEVVPATGIHTASVMQAMGGTEMRVGMHSAEFGDISIRTSVSPQQMQTQISVDHGDLGQAITAHASLVQARFQEQYGMQASIHVNQQGSASSGEPGGSAQREQQGFVRSVGNEGDAPADEAEISLGQLAIAGAGNGPGANGRLDIRA